MKRLVILVLVLLITLPAAAMADSGRGYVSAFIGTNMVKDTTITDYSASPPYRDRLEFDPGTYGGVTGGIDFGMLRLEGEISYRGNEVDSLTEEDGTTHSDFDGYVGLTAFMLNAFIDIETGSMVTPYVGGGVGLANLSIEDLPFYEDDDDTVLAYQLGAGLGFNITRSFTVDLGYRYFDTERADFYKASMDYRSHAVAVGFRYTF